MLPRLLWRNKMKISDIKKKPVAYILVGLPGSGKSTWMRNLMSSDEEYVVVSSDDEIEKYAKSKGLTYSDVFDEYVKTATSLMNHKFKEAIQNNMNIIWDQTNMNSKKRRSILQQLSQRYRKVAVVFQVDDSELDRRLKKRAQEEGKHIPNHVIDSMRRSFEMPSRSEGFDEVIIT